MIRWTRHIFLASIMLFAILIASAQTTIHPKISFISAHPFSEPNRHLFDNNIDANKTFVVEPLLMVSIETMIRDDSFSWRIMPGIYSDAASKPAFFFHAGLKLRLFQTFRHSFHFAAGGSLLGRRRWDSYSDYVPESGFSANGTWEYRLEPMGELEYALMINQQNDFTASIMYGHQHKSFTFTLGYRYWLSSSIKHPSNCGSCPFQK